MNFLAVGRSITSPPKSFGVFLPTLFFFFGGVSGGFLRMVIRLFVPVSSSSDFTVCFSLSLSLCLIVCGGLVEERERP